MKKAAIILAIIASLAVVGTGCTSTSSDSSSSSSISASDDNESYYMDLAREGEQLAKDAEQNAFEAADEIGQGDIVGGCSHVSSLQSQVNRLTVIAGELSASEYGSLAPGLDENVIKMNSGMTQAAAACAGLGQ